MVKSNGWMNGGQKGLGCGVHVLKSREEKTRGFPGSCEVWGSTEMWHSLFFTPRSLSSHLVSTAECVSGAW